VPNRPTAEHQIRAIGPVRLRFARISAPIQYPIPIWYRLKSTVS
jgi:hypothetical protein